MMFPEKYTHNGVEYSVNVSFSSDGEVEYYNLTDASGEILCEEDWSGDFDEEVIRDNIETYGTYF